jgi:outer membrane protein assembly factor BamD (BamD/ComL family)
LLRYPGAADRDDVRNVCDTIRAMRAEKDYSIGAYYERTGHLSSAIYYYKSVCTSWPGTIASAKAASRLELLGVHEPGAVSGSSFPEGPSVESSEIGNR